MNILNSLQAWLEATTLYNKYLLHMPAPLNNIYFDTILVILIIAYCVYRIIDDVRIYIRHRRMKKRMEQKNDEAAVISTPAVTTPADIAASVYDKAMSDLTRMENQHITDELNKVRVEKAQLETLFEEKEKQREKSMERVKQQMIEQVNEKQSEVDALKTKLQEEKLNSEKQITQMTDTLNVYKTNMQKKIESLEAEKNAQIKADPDADITEQQEHINRLVAEMEQMKATQEQAIQQQETEFNRHLSEQENKIAELESEKQSLQRQNTKTIDELAVALRKAHDEQENIKQAKEKEVKELTKQLEMQQAKQSEIENVRREQQEEVVKLQTALDDVKRKADMLSNDIQQRDEAIAMLQNELAVKETSSETDYNTLTRQVEALKAERDKALLDKQTADSKINNLYTRLDDVKQEHERQISIKQAEIDELMKLKDDDVDVSDIPDSIDTDEEDTASYIIPVEPVDVVKPNFGAVDEACDKMSEFDRLLRQHEEATADERAIRAAEEADDKRAMAHKKVLERGIVKE